MVFSLNVGLGTSTEEHCRGIRTAKIHAQCAPQAIRKVTRAHSMVFIKLASVFTELSEYSKHNNIKVKKR